MGKVLRAASAALLLVLVGLVVGQWALSRGTAAIVPGAGGREAGGDPTVGSQTGPTDPDDTEPPADPAFSTKETEEEHLATCQYELDPAQITSSSFWIDIDVTKQVVRIMEDDDVVHREMICSTGVEGKETPLGTFEIQNRGEWFYNDKYKQGAKYWVSFKDWGVYLFHTVAMDSEKNVIEEEAAKLGAPASHGCIRLEVENAKWIYEHIPQHTKVVIHE